MAAVSEKTEVKEPITVADSVCDCEEIKLTNTGSVQRLPDGFGDTARSYSAAAGDLLEATAIAATLTLEETRLLMTQVHKQHARDPNFPIQTIRSIEEFIWNEDVFINPDKYQHLIEDMKIQAALITNNSPYAEVRAVVDNHDDPTLPVSTIRAWCIGILFACIISFVNSFFDVRMPGITLGAGISQLIAFPAGKFCERVLPDIGFTLFGVRHSLNPGPFNKKEHMLITIMSTVAVSVPYTNYIVWIQVLPRYFGQAWATDVKYQLLIGISTNFIGYGMAGLCRQWLVYPASCVWPSSLVTIAMNSAFHSQASESPTVLGPLRSVWRASRMRYFCWAFGTMFLYFWLPNFLFPALSYFSWMTWIAPHNKLLDVVTGFSNGLGFNPLPTLDWNVVASQTDPLMLPFFSTFNFFLGALVAGFVILAVYLTNSFYTAYLPINSNRPYDHFGDIYNVSRVVNDKAIFDSSLYEQYSPPFLSASNLTVYMFFFALYSATVTYGVLYHRGEIAIGLREFWTRTKAGALKAMGKTNGAEKEAVTMAERLDVHNRLMKVYPEVPEWWYMICLAVAVILGMLGIGLWPTNTNPAVVLYGIALCLVFVVPIGIIAAMTGVLVTLNVLAEFIGGVIMEGNGIGMSFFKAYGYVTCAHAISFTSDLKLAHYLKIPPRFTFWAQMVPALVSTFISVAIIQYQVHIEGICTPDAPFRFTCPGINTFFTAAVFWGTIGPRKIWGVGGQYTITLIGFPLGVVGVVLFWWLNKRFPNNSIIRNAHPVVMFAGCLIYAPYSMGYMWPAVPVAAFSWLYLRKRYPEFWSKYNYVTSAAFTTGIALSGVIMFFAVQMHPVHIKWWGTDIVSKGCEYEPCVLKNITLEGGKYFGPAIGEFH